MPRDRRRNREASANYDWNKLREEVKKNGVRNSLLLAPMPTASTSQILGNNECFEPYTSNFYTRRTLSGEYIVVNKHLLEDLIRLGLWNQEMKEQLMASNGSVQHIHQIPQDLKELYKTAWEISQRSIIDMSADRGAYICQSQSLNLFLENATFGKLSSMHFHAWQRGLKTGMYYLRTKAAVDPIKFTLSEKHQRKFVAADGEATNVIEEVEMVPQKQTAMAKEDILQMLHAVEPLQQQFEEGKVCDMSEGCESCSA